MSNSMFANFTSNPKNEKAGVALEYGDFRVIVARAGGANKAFEKTMEELVHPYRRAMKMGAMKDDKSLEILYTAYARSVIKDWQYRVKDEGSDEDTWQSGIQDPTSGEVVEPTEEVLIAVFKRFPDLFLDIKEAASSLRTFQTEDDQAAVGN